MGADLRRGHLGPLPGAVIQPRLGVSLLGPVPQPAHLFTVEPPGVLFLLGSGGRDLFSRNPPAARLSLSVGLIGVAMSFVLGCIVGNNGLPPSGSRSRTQRRSPKSQKTTNNVTLLV